MANIITAGNSTNGGTAISTDTSGTLNIVTGSGSGSNAITIDASQNVAMTASQTVAGNLTVTGSITGGSISVANSLRAWVNFNGTGTIATRGSFNVSSITDGGTGNYTINFTTAMIDANYCPVVGMSQGAAAGGVHQLGQTGPNLNSNNFAAFGTGSLKIVTGSPSASTPFDVDSLNIAVFR
jgi:hypothetical protein